MEGGGKVRGEGGSIGVEGGERRRRRRRRNAYVSGIDRWFLMFLIC